MHACPTLVGAQRPRYDRGEENKINSENLSRSAYTRNFFFSKILLAAHLDLFTIKHSYLALKELNQSTFL